MSQNLVPTGFEAMSHRIFKHFSPPTFIEPSLAKTVKLKSDNSENTTISPYCDGYFPSSSSFLARITTNRVLHSNNQVCSICVECMEDPVTIVQCSHSYCFVCLTAWYKTKQSCPLCNHAEAEFVKFSNDKTNNNGIDYHHIEVWRFKKQKLGKKRERKQGSITDPTIHAIDVHRKRFRTTACRSNNLEDQQDNLPSAPAVL